MSINQTVTVDGVSYQLSDYPTAYVAVADNEYGDAVALLEARGYTPDTCPEVLVSLHQARYFTNGKVSADPFPQFHHVGQIGDVMEFDADEQPVVWADEEREAIAFMAAWVWCERNAKADWYIRFKNTQIGVDAFFGFADPADEAAFLVANKGA
ncbi:hypothetical protein [Sphingobium yanoikuyae]|uniref:hypothetical protein n=1 Tax=Sphingobium yanoikuyae TaxID=13690 RepID=UPI0028A841D1|nr:hypothetical protein [Sphingobium yanoikuyae]